MIECVFLISGMVLGLAAGISPGPLLTLVISETLTHSRKEGILVAAAPLLTDIPIVLIALFVLGKVSNSDSILGVICVGGAVFLASLGYESLRCKTIRAAEQPAAPQSLKKGILINLLSPHPYIFWIAVGAPTVWKAFQVSVTAAVLFVGGFYLLLVGAKIIVAWATDRSKGVLQSRGYVVINKLLGVTLCIFSLLFLKEACELFGIF